MLTDGIQHPLILWWLCVPLPLGILAAWGAIVAWKHRREIKW